MLVCENTSEHQKVPLVPLFQDVAENNHTAPQSRSKQTLTHIAMTLKLVFLIV